jgi:hypothetical protein
MAVVNSGVLATPELVNWDVIPGEKLKQLKIHQIQYMNNSDEDAEIGWGEQVPVVLGRLLRDGSFEKSANPAAVDYASSNVYAFGVLSLTADIVLSSVAPGPDRNGDTFTLEVEAAAANPTNTVLAAFTGDANDIVLTVTPNNGANNPANAQAAAVLSLTDDITLTSVAAGSGRNTNTFTIQVLAAADNPTDTVLVAFSGTAAAIVCTITPNDGTNNGAVPVDLTTGELVQLINTGAVVGKAITLTDADSRRVLQTATGGGPTALADAGEGDGVAGTFSGGTTVTVGLTTAEIAQLINTGAVVGKNVTVTDASSLRALQTAGGGGATLVANSGEGDGEVATFEGGDADVVLAFPKPVNVVQISIDQEAGVALDVSYWDGSVWQTLTARQDIDFESGTTQALILDIPNDWVRGAGTAGGLQGWFCLRVENGAEPLAIEDPFAGRILDKIGAIPADDAGIITYPIDPLGLFGSHGLFTYVIQSDDGDPSANSVIVDYESI